jgi:predicted nucleotidyltransferase
MSDAEHPPLLRVPVPEERIVEFCRRHGVRRLCLFGSVLRDDFGPASDVDVLIEFEPDRGVGLIALATLEQELTRILGRTVDLRTPNELSRYFRDEVVRTAAVLYAA